MSLKTRLTLLRFLTRRRAPAVSAIEPDLLQMLGLENPFTPDYHDLEQQEFSFVFVPDEMQTGHWANTMVVNDDSVRLAAAFTTDKFVMYEKTLGKRRCGVVLAENKVDRLATRGEAAILKGELYAVRAKQMEQLDIYKQNGKIFTRRKVRLDIRLREEQEYMTKVTVIKHTSDSDSVAQYAENVTKVLGEWKTYGSQEAWLYVGDPEYFFWNNYTNPSDFRPLKPRISSDRNLRACHVFI